MKKLKLLIGVAVLALATVSIEAQTNNQVENLLGTNSPIKIDPTISHGIQEIYDAALGSTNFAIATGGGRSLKGQNNLGFVDYLYNFNSNAGLVLGYDYTWTGHAAKFQQSNLSFVKGGFNVQADITPFKNFGLTNLTLTPFTAILIDSSGGQVGQIIVGGVDWKAASFHGWKFNLGGFYENRTGGNTSFDGAYLCAHIAMSRGF